jgi:acylphosphatase
MKKLFLLFFALFGFLQVSSAQAFTNMPPLNREQSKILEKGILGYVQSYPDSVDATIYLKLKSVREFISSVPINSADSVRTFLDIPVKIVNQIERTEYMGDIVKWVPEKQMELMMAITYEKQAADMRKTLRIRKEFQCKYFLKVGLPCPN